jgi:(+)-pinoresinol hydroxylase
MSASTRPQASRGLAIAIALAGMAVTAAASGAAPATHPASPSAADPRPYISWTWTTIVAKPGEPRGWAQFQRACAVCHGRGPAKPGTRALRTKYEGKLPALLEQRTDLSARYIRYIVRHGVNVMPPFRKTELSDRDLDAIVSYLTRRHPS